MLSVEYICLRNKQKSDVSPKRTPMWTSHRYKNSQGATFQNKLNKNSCHTSCQITLIVLRWWLYRRRYQHWNQI